MTLNEFYGQNMSVLQMDRLSFHCVHCTVEQEAQLQLREQAVSFLLSSHHNTTHGNLAILSLVLRYGWDL